MIFYSARYCNVNFFVILAADVGSLVRLITANDRDRNPTLLYDFTPNGNPGNTFTIDRFSGRITLAKPLDHEVRKHYAVGLSVCFYNIHATYLYF